MDSIFQALISISLFLYGINCHHIPIQIKIVGDDVLLMRKKNLILLYFEIS